MKSKMLRIISMILIMASLISMFAIFASAETEGEETEDEETEEEVNFNLLYNRTYDEGWDVKNGLKLVINNGIGESTFEIDHETTIDFTYNYFWRLEVGATKNDYLEMDMGSVENIGTVLEFDVMSDDICTINNVVNFGTAGGGYEARTDYNFLTVKDNVAYFFSSGDYNVFPEGAPAAFELSTSWTRVKLLFDYTYEHMPVDYDYDSPEVIEEKLRVNRQWIRTYVYFGPADGSAPMQLLTGEPLIIRADNGRGIQMFRFQTSGEPESNFGTSICFDNIKAYTGTNQFVDITPEMGYGSLVDPNYIITENIIGGTVATGNDIRKALSMKVGVDYCYVNSKKTPIATAQDGTVYGAPVKVNGKVMVPLHTILDYLGYPYYMHPDGVYMDISTGTSATYLVLGKDSATVGSVNVSLAAAPGYVTDENGNSYLVIALEDIEVLFPGYYGDYDDMGFMTISSNPNLLDRELNLNAMVDIMKEFIYDYPLGEQIYNDVEANTNGFEHPYLLANAEQLDAIHAEYMALEEREEEFLAMDQDPNLSIADAPDEFMMWVHYYRLVDYYGDGAYEMYALPDESGSYDTFVGLSDDSTRRSSYSLLQPYYIYDENGNRLEGKTSYTYVNPVTGEKEIWTLPSGSSGYGDGYDTGGRSDITNRTQFLERMGIAYAISRDIKYLQCAYEVALALGEWTHWGPGHFLNCADSSYDFAIYYDLTYQGYKELAAQGITRPNGEPYDVDVLTNILFNQGVHEGYLSVNNINEHLSHVVGTGGAFYSARDNNWHAVCVSGMVTAALAVMGECDGAFYDETTFLISDNLKTLVTYGMAQYIPDGSYIEGPGYWNYGTNSFFKLCESLDNASGTNYGLMDTWGIDTTCYFACHTESSDGRTFNFHDGSMSGQDTSYFFYVANTYNDATLYDVRYNQIRQNLKWATFTDLIYYPRDMSNAEGEEIVLDYYTDSIDLFATRSGWETGSLYAAIIGGTNNLGHGQIDAGSFVYHNSGNVWIIDLGTENYNCVGFWPAATRYRYYVMKPEGNNTIAIATDPASTPYGQELNSAADAYDWGSNEYGAYVLYDMTDTLGPTATRWERGMMLTNDRKTTVIQDQIILGSMQTVWWFAHYYDQRGSASSYGVQEIEISKDGRTAYMKRYIGKNEHEEMQYETLRLSIVSNNKTYKFQIMDCYTFIHTGDNGTYTKDYAENNGSRVPENDRSRYGKLAICSGSTVDFNIAVVIELVDTDTVGKDREIEVGYNYVDMRKWTPGPDTRGEYVEDTNTVLRRGVPNVNIHVALSMAKADRLISENSAYTTRVSEFYRALTDAYYAVRMLGTDMPSGYEAEIAALNTYREAFGLYQKEVNRLAGAQTEFVYKVMGLK